MNRRENRWCPLRFDRHSARFHDAKRAAQKRLRGYCSKTNDDLRFDERDLVLKPREAGANLARVRRFMQTTRRTCLSRPLEVLHRVGDVDVVAIDSSFVERAVEKFSGRPDEGPSRFVLGVAGLFTDDDHTGSRRTFAEDRLRSALEQVATATAFRRRAQLRERRARWNEVSRGAGWLRCFSRLRHVADGLHANGDVRQSGGRRRPCPPEPAPTRPLVRSLPVCDAGSQ